MKNPSNILITGSTSGIGFQLASLYSKNKVNLFLTGRNKTKLNNIHKICEKNGAQVFIKLIDVRNKESVYNWIKEIHKIKKINIDLAILNAGISAGTSGKIESDIQVETIFETNVNGVINYTNAIIPFMKKNNKGQIAIMSSLASFKGLPSCPSYSASKGSMRIYGEALRGNLKKYNIKINVICPGYIRTPMTQKNDFYMPFLMDSEKAAKIIKCKLQNNKPLIAFPTRFYLIILLITALPNKISELFLSKLPTKKQL